MALGGFLKIGLSQRQRLGPCAAQADTLDPEPGIDIVKLARKEGDDVRRIAARRSQFEAADDDIAINLPHAQFEPPCTQRFAFEFARHVFG